MYKQRHQENFANRTHEENVTDFPRSAYHVGIAYMIWGHKGNREIDPTEYARKIREQVYQVSSHSNLASKTGTRAL